MVQPGRGAFGSGVGVGLLGLRADRRGIGGAFGVICLAGSGLWSALSGRGAFFGLGVGCWCGRWGLGWGSIG